MAGPMTTELSTLDLPSSSQAYVAVCAGEPPMFLSSEPFVNVAFDG
jgi:hypothetical protein